LKTLHKKIHYVASTAAEVLGDSSKFPADWLFSYRWGKTRAKKKKGEEESDCLPTGEKIIHITVGGRTSAVVESRQKKIKNTDEEDDEQKEPTPKRVKKGKDAAPGVNEKRQKPSNRELEEDNVTPKKRRVSGKAETKGTPKSTSTRKSPRTRSS
jgi:formamidopyrimidine-DNA glycosylase